MSMKEKLAVTVLVTTLALFGLVVVLYRMIKDKNEDYTQIVLNQHSSYDSRTIPSGGISPLPSTPTFSKKFPPLLTISTR